MITHRNKLFGVILFLLIFLSNVHAQKYKSSAEMSKEEVSQIISNLQNQKNVELMMFALKSIEELNITAMDEKLEFVDTLQISDEIKNWAKTQIKQNITYSDHERTSYGIYQFKKCNHNPGSKSGSLASVYSFIYNMNTGHCVSQLKTVVIYG